MFFSDVWKWYQQNREDIAPFLAPFGSLAVGLGTVVVGGLVARAALRQARTATRVAEIANSQAEIARLRHEEQTKADQRRRITDSFSKATEQLGSDKTAVRLGGIYTLERISRESPDDYWIVMETLCAFVRERAPWQSAEEESPETVARYYQKAEATGRRSGPPTDIAAVLAVITRRNEEGQKAESKNKEWILDFREADLRGADLREANLSRASLIWAVLWEADLSETDLSEADFREADLSEACLSRANLSKAHLSGANLSRADLSGANLSEAELREANLSSAILSHNDLSQAEAMAVLTEGKGHLSRDDLMDDSRWAGLLKTIKPALEITYPDPDGTNLSWKNLMSNLTKADLVRANLDEANLGGAELGEADLRGAKLRKATLIVANLSNAKLVRADLSGADLSGADLNGADLASANLGRAILCRARLSGAVLWGADVGGVDLNGADLRKANLSHVDLRQAKGLLEKQLAEATGDAKTQLPVNLLRPAHWPSAEPRAD